MRRRHHHGHFTIFVVETQQYEFKAIFKGVPREQLKRRYAVHKVKGKTRMVARIPKGQKGAGRFAKRG